jgi:hypothetical protein
MATDAEIQKFVQRHHGFIPKTGGSLMSRKFTAYRRCAARPAPVVIVTSSRARPKSVRRSKRRFGTSV